MKVLIVDDSQIADINRAVKRALRPIVGGGGVQVRETDSNILITGQMQNPVLTPPANDEHVIRLHNTSTETTVEGGCAIVVSYDPTDNHYDIIKPNADCSESAVVVMEAIEANKVGNGRMHGKADAVVSIVSPDTDPIVGTHLGSSNGSWLWKKSSTGNLLVDGIKDASTHTARVRFRRDLVVYSDGYAWLNTVSNTFDSRTKAAVTLWQNVPSPGSPASPLFQTEAWLHFPVTNPLGYYPTLVLGLNLNIWGIVWVAERGTAQLTLTADWITQAWDPATINPASLPTTQEAAHTKIDLSAYCLPLVSQEEPPAPPPRYAKAVYAPRGVDVTGDSYNSPYQTLVPVLTTPPATIYGLRLKLSCADISPYGCQAWRWQSYFVGKSAIIHLET